MLAYLAAENAYSEFATAHLAGLRSQLFAQLRSRISETHDSLAVPKGEWEYFTRTVEGKAYPIHLRRPRSPASTSGSDTSTSGSDTSTSTSGITSTDTSHGESVLLDENLVASGHNYFSIGDVAVSPNQRLLAYTADTTGNEMHELFVVDLATGETISRGGDQDDGFTYGLAWANDNRTMFLVGADEAQRSNRVLLHTIGIGTANGNDHGNGTSTDQPAIFVEQDERFWVGINKTRSERFVVITSESETTSECYLIDLGSTDLGSTAPGSAATAPPTALPTDPPALVRQRCQDVLYRVHHQTGDQAGDQTGPHQQPGRLLIVTNNDEAENFYLAEAPLRQNANGLVVGDWSVLVAHRQDTRLEDIDCFETFAVLHERTNATTQLRLLPAGSAQAVPLTEIDDSPFEISAAANLEYSTTTLRYEFTSLTTPPAVLETDVPGAAGTDPPGAADPQDAANQPTATGPPSTASPNSPKPRLLYQAPIANGVDLAAYQSARLWAQAPDHTKVPISVVWRPDCVSWPAPCLLYGYGAYETVIPAAYSAARISLLDRGVVFAIAHVRGGGELGRNWYKQGRLANKQNTFDDFVACARYLIAERWTEPSRLVARGASAGGLLMGAVYNQAPELFAGVVAEVPFVDALNTMLDPSIPLTITEFDEWGDPSQLADFQTIQRYSPYENVLAAEAGAPRPALLATAGLNDPRVQYWEPAKWVAKLRSGPADESTADGAAADGAAADESTAGGNAAEQRPILLRTEMSAGHGGATGRYDIWRDEAYVQAFVLDVLGLAD